MTTKAQYLQSLVDKFIHETKRWPVPLREVAKWAVRRGLWKPAPYLVEQKCAQELSEALREEYAYDPQGRKIRLKHAYIDPDRPEQGVLWADIRTAPEKHIKIAFEMRRQQIIGDCYQLKLDLDSYNENHNPKKLIQMSFDFEDEISHARSHLKEAS